MMKSLQTVEQLQEPVEMAVVNPQLHRWNSS